MPLSAIHAGVVDFILAPEKIPGQLLQINKAYKNSHIYKQEEQLPKDEKDIYKQILLVLHQRSGVDFTYYKQPGLGMVLSPAYDLVNTALVNPEDDEEMALSLNGKKKKLKKQDFVDAMNTLKVEEKQQQNIFNKMEKARPKWIEQIDNSFLTEEFKIQYVQIVTERFERIKK